MAQWCFDCGEWGHKQAECPNFESQMQCYECGEWGHTDAECSNFESLMDQCYECGERGHTKAECPNFESHMLCYECGEWGHTDAECSNFKSPIDQCYECGERGHKQADCPNIECHHCHHRGHMARDCQWFGTQEPQIKSPPHTMDKSQPFYSSTPLPSSDAHNIPSHWQMSKKYDSLTRAITRLWKLGMKFRICLTDRNESTEIHTLLMNTWYRDVVGCGTDAHSHIKVVKVVRVENPELYERYCEKKQKLLRRLRDSDAGGAAFSRVDRLPGSSGPVLTTQCLPFDSILRQNICTEINEHYMFHGTKENNALIIARDGMDNRFGNRSSLLGPGLYTAESCTKADQNADKKSGRTNKLLKMFLVRVLLGEPYVNTEKNPPKFQRPPCMSCQQILCTCPHTVHYDSVLDDSGRLFREFVVYEQTQCYPEYIIAYRRVWGSAAASLQPSGSASASKNRNPSSPQALALSSAQPPDKLSDKRKAKTSSASQRSVGSLGPAQISPAVLPKFTATPAKRKADSAVASTAVKASAATTVLAVSQLIASHQSVERLIPEYAKSFFVREDSSGDGKGKTSNTSQRSPLFRAPDEKPLSPLAKSTATPTTCEQDSAIDSTAGTTSKATSITKQADAIASPLSQIVDSSISAKTNIISTNVQPANDSSRWSCDIL